MILSDREIKAAIERGVINITPRPSVEAWSSTSVDLCLAAELVRWKTPTGGGAVIHFSPAADHFNLDSLQAAYSDKFDLSTNPYIFKPNTFLLAWTIEKLKLPFRSRLAA